MTAVTKMTLAGLLAAGSLALVFAANSGETLAQANGDPKSELLAAAKARGLSADDMVAAVATYPQPGEDEFVCLNSGGQAASVIAYAVPSMRVLKYIPTSAPDSATGFTFDAESDGLHRQGYIDGQRIDWGDTHHPGFSETDGRYNGRFAFINDKANPRIFVIDLRDFETKQIVPNKIFRSNHGGAFVTPNTEYIMESAQYPTTVDHKYQPLEQAHFNEFMRGGVTFHKFDMEKGRVDLENSFTLLAPPYVQDLSDAGKGESYGWSFTNSLCAERYIGGIEKGRPPFEAGCSSRDTDFLHVVNWKKAEAVVAAGKAEKVRGHHVIPLELAIEEELLFLVPEPKSPHGVDVTPDGRYIIVAGKLDTHASIYDMRKIKALIEAKDFAERDPYGLPILDYKKALHGSVQLGLGPLHTQFVPAEGIAYTSVYIDSVVAKWDYINLKRLETESVHYNIGHLVSMQGDSQDPRGKYLIALNKLAIDRFNNVGPLHPQNHQLVAIDGEKMRLLYDLPLPMGEPHYTACIDVKDIAPIDTYEPGTDPTQMAKSSHAVTPGNERVERNGTVVEVFGALSRSGIVPQRIEATQGDRIVLHLTNVEVEGDATIEASVGGLNAMSVYPAGKTATLEFVATQAGLFPIRIEAVDNPFPSQAFGLLSVAPNAAAERKRIAAVSLARAEHQRLRRWTYTDLDSALAPGEKEFTAYGCSGCHQMGRELGGPDLTAVTARRPKEWLVQWIVNPEQYYDDPYVAAMIKRYGIKMPKQGVTVEEAERIVGWLDTWKATEEVQTASVAVGDDHPGAQVYGKICYACHEQGIAGAPKIGDEKLWRPRLAKGTAALTQSVLNGYQGEAGYMPPRGGCPDCTDEDLKNALDYIVGRVK